jgi:hypothetical protein
LADGLCEQYEALWALTNIASGTHEHTEFLVKMGAIDFFRDKLNSPHPKVKEQACWALGNIAGDCADMRDLVLSAGIMNDTLRLLVGS